MPTSQQAELDRVRIHHFHSHNRIRLTIYTHPFKNPLNPEETLYAVGMALCHKTDNGSRKDGVFLASRSAGVAEGKVLRGQAMPLDNNFTSFIEPGMSIWRHPQALKNLIVNLRYVERFCANSKAFSTYTKVFRGDFNVHFTAP